MATCSLPGLPDSIWPCARPTPEGLAAAVRYTLPYPLPFRTQAGPVRPLANSIMGRELPHSMSRGSARVNVGLRRVLPRRGKRDRVDLTLPTKRHRRRL